MSDARRLSSIKFFEYLNGYGIIIPLRELLGSLFIFLEISPYILPIILRFSLQWF